MRWRYAGCNDTFNYEELSPSEQGAIVPICVKSTAEQGNLIDWGWFEAAACVQDQLRALARSMLDDVWRASEITEAAVHNLWSKHGHNLGLQPSRQIFVAAKWEARDRKAGTWQNRRKVLRAFDDLEDVVRNKLLADPANYSQLYENDLYFEDCASSLRPTV